MVSLRRALACGLLVGLAAAPPANGQDVDWNEAGGALFADPAPADAEGGTSAPTEAVAVLEPAQQPWAREVAAAAERHGLDAKLLHALVVVESAYRPDACSPAGACGLAQLMPATAHELGVEDRFDPAASLDGGADYLARQLGRFRDLRLALAAYNAGPARVARLGRVPDIAETQRYVTAVIDCYLSLTAGRAARTARDCAPVAGDAP
jgi:soluble lytic murein transglycosylase-like protein